jgi:hypothetical protein
MSVFTVYCHGTGFNRSKGTHSDELVAYFHNHTIGGEAIMHGGTVTGGTYMINEGPGHGGAGGVALPQHVSPQTGNVQNVSKLAKTFANTKGVLVGAGWDENVERTVNMIRSLNNDHGAGIDVVNLCGWSRGAVTCMRITNRMYGVFGNAIRCNVFAVDPVAGMSAGKTMEDTQVLESNVTDYVGILAMHEMRQTFKPQDWSRIHAPGTTAVFLPMPGVHNAQVMVKAPPDAARITRNLACGLLRYWGTNINSVPFGFLCGAQDMCLAYARLVLSLSEHKKYESATTGGRLGGSPSLRRRNFAKTSKMDTYTRGGKSSYWINDHHRACFASAFPAAYPFIFESSGSGEARLSPQSRYAALYAAVTNPMNSTMRDSLLAKDLLGVDSTGNFLIGQGAGSYSNQTRSMWPDALPLHA